MNKIKYLLDIAQKFENNTISEHLSDYYSLIDLLIHLNEKLAESKAKVSEWEYASETLLLKFAFHGISLHSIYNGIKFKSQYHKNPNIESIEILDISSGKAIMRSQFETLLMFLHIYANTKNDSESELRYFAWIYTALKNRQKQPALSESSKIQKEKDYVRIEELRGKIKKISAFNDLTDKQQMQLLENGSGKLFKHWSKIIDESGFPKGSPLSEIYSYLSIYAHSEGLSAIQLKTTKFMPNHPITLEQVKTDLTHSKLMICVFISEYANKFVQVNEVLNGLPEKLTTEIEFYYKIAKRLPNNV